MERLYYTRPFGVELEVGNNLSLGQIRDVVAAHTPRQVQATVNWSKTSGNAFWHIKRDGSCGPLGPPIDSGWEIASFVAKSKNDLLHIDRIASALNTAGAQVNENCGFHVHISLHDFAPSQAAVLYAYWMKAESLMLQAVPLHRTCNRHCRPMSKSRKFRRKENYSAEDFWAKMRPRNFSDWNNSDRRVILNFVPYCQAIRLPWFNTKRTVELRLPEGTLNPTEINGWVRLMLWFVARCKRLKMPSDLLPFELEELFQFLRFDRQLDKDLLATKDWMVGRFLQFGRPKTRRKCRDKIAPKYRQN